MGGAALERILCLEILNVGNGIVPPGGDLSMQHRCVVAGETGEVELQRYDADGGGGGVLA